MECFPLAIGPYSQACLALKENNTRLPSEREFSSGQDTVAALPFQSQSIEGIETEYLGTVRLEGKYNSYEHNRAIVIQ